MMKQNQTARESKLRRLYTYTMKHHPSGFALIATISIMSLLLLVSVAMLSSSSIETRNARAVDHEDTARANARMGLMLAIGELQNSVGPDQRITAPSQLFSDPNQSVSNIAQQYLTGVWTARNEELGQTPDYDRTNSFQRWLVSNSDTSNLTNAEFVIAGQFNDPVTMVGAPGGNATDIKDVEAGKIEVTGGKLAWWVGDENTKGFSLTNNSLARNSADMSLVDHMASLGTPGAYGMESIDPEFPANTQNGDKVITREAFALALENNDETGEWFHDLSPHAKGILSNVTKGGLRKDLNLYLEKPREGDSWPRAGGPAKIGPNNKYALSEFDDYDVLSWKRLHEHYNFRSNIQSIGGRPTLAAYRNGEPDKKWNSGILRPAPVLTRFLMFISFGSIPDPQEEGKYVVRFYTYPVITVWNPYNVDITVSPEQMSILSSSFPTQHRIRVGGQLKEIYKWRNGNGRDNSGGSIIPVLAENFVLKAGEAKTLTPDGENANTRLALGLHQVHKVRDRPFEFSPSSPGGLWGAGGFHDSLISRAKGNSSDMVEIETRVVDWESGGGAFTSDYPATWDLRMSSAGGEEFGWETYQWSNKIGWRHERGTPELGNPGGNLKSNDNPRATLGEISDAPRPFMVVDAKLKALDELDVPNKTWRDTIPSHPFQAVTQNQSDATVYFSQAYKLDFNTINSYEGAASYLNDSEAGSTNTYFGSSYLPSEGQSFITDREIPLAPMSSLAQLQHVPQHSHDNTFASGFYFQNRAIGNSYASPGVSADKVKQAGVPFNLDVYSNSVAGDISGRLYGRDEFLQRPNIDRSYAANHLLWDDYFFSSMAAKDSNLRASNERKPLENVVREFYEEGEQLANNRYKPHLAESTTEIINKLVKSNGEPTDDGFKKVASYLTVDGMFNVNSTSVKAWKTLLASAHKKRMVVMEASGGNPTTTEEARFVVSRFTMPNGGSADGANAADAEQLKWRGYRELTELQLEELAEAMVRQVKERGPFRSLSEFINRRLAPESDDKSLYGALQAALEDPAVSINEEYRARVITEADIKEANYANKRAALGPRYQGSPPYVNQADILNTIGPVLSARSDTFVVRGYGESLDERGKVVAKAWCEAIVQRIPDYVDPVDEPHLSQDELVSDLNRRLGRKIQIVSFRWLSEKER